MKRPSFVMCFVVATVLLISAAYGLLLISDRVVAAVIDYWKFGRAHAGIDLGAQSSFYFIEFCLFGVSASAGLNLFTRESANRYLNLALLGAGAIYLLNGLVVLFLVSSGWAFLYCGR